MNLNCKATIKQVVQVTNKDNGEVEFYIEKDNKWQKITKKDYQKIIRGEQ